MLSPLAYLPLTLTWGVAHAALQVDLSSAGKFRAQLPH